MTGHLQTERAKAQPKSDGSVDHRAAPDLSERALGRSDSVSNALNGSPQAQSLLQMRQALDESPGVRSQLTLQRALNRRGAGPAHDHPREASPHPASAPVQRKPNNTGLPDQLKAGVEQLSGLAMDDVRVYFNSPKPATVQAHAYAQGADIHLAPGQERHLPHEAWHVAQQKQGRVKPTLQMKGVAINDDWGLEREADAMGDRALRANRGELAVVQAFGLRVAPVEAPPLPVVQRIATQIIADPETDKITQVLIGGRPISPFSGTMGDHSTAFALQIEAVRSRLEGKAPSTALNGLRSLYINSLKLPGMGFVDNLEARHKNMLKEASDLILRLLSSTPETDLTLHLQECVNAYLAFRELIPLSLVNLREKSPALAGKGKGESGALEKLRSALDVQQESKAESKMGNPDLLAAVLGLLDVGGVAHAAIESDNRRFALMAPGLPPPPDEGLDESTVRERIQYYVLQHLGSIEAAFPRAADKLPEPERITAAVLVRARSELVKDRGVYLGLAKARIEQQKRRLSERSTLQARLSYAVSQGLKKGQKNAGTRIAQQLFNFDEETKRLHNSFVEMTAPLLTINRILKTGEEPPPWPTSGASMSSSSSSVGGPKKRKRSAGEDRKADESGGEIKNTIPVSSTSISASDSTDSGKTRPAGSTARRAETKSTSQSSSSTSGSSVSLTDPSTPNVEESKSEAETKETRVQKEETTDTLVNQIIVKEGKIAGLISAGRARSPFSGTMGAHTTAWSIKVDQVRRLLLKNETLDGAYGAIVKLAQTTVSGAAENVEKLKEQIEAYERKAKKPKQGGSTTDLDESDLMQKSNQLLGLQKAESEIVTWMSARRTFLSLQQLISALLRYQNFVPGATLEAADTGGKGEPHALEILGNPEQYAAEKIQWALVRTLDLSSENENQAVLLAKHLDSMKSQYNEAWSLSGMQRMTPEQRYEIALSAWETKDDSEFHPIKKRQKLKGTKAESKEKTIATTNQDRPKNTSRTPYTSGPGGLRSKL